MLPQLSLHSRIPLSIRKYPLIFSTKNDCEGQPLIPKFSIHFGSYPLGPLSHLTFLWFLPLSQLSGDYSRSAYLSVDNSDHADGYQHLKHNIQLILNTSPLPALTPALLPLFFSVFSQSPNFKTTVLKYLIPPSFSLQETSGFQLFSLPIQTLII